MLEVRNLAVKYDLISAIAGLSITAAERTITSIVGSNGAGKTTLLKAISGLIHPAEGEITFLGERIDAASAPDIVRMGISQVPEGRDRDSAWDSVPDRERPELRSRFERWLDPEDFGPDGSARARLGREGERRV